MTTDLDQLLSRCLEVEAAGRTAPQPSRAMWDADRIARDLFLPLVECAAAGAELRAAYRSGRDRPEHWERFDNALSALEKAGKESGL